MFKVNNLKTANRTIKSGMLSLNEYLDGQIALILDADEDYIGERVSVNLAGYNMYPKYGCVFIPDYAEHEGMAQGLEAQGAVKILRPITFGMGTGFEVKLDDSMMDEYEGWIEDEDE